MRLLSKEEKYIARCSTDLPYSEARAWHRDLEAPPQEPQGTGRQMAIIVDPDVVIRGEKGTSDLKNWVTSRPNDRFEITAIAVAELWHSDPDT